MMLLKALRPHSHLSESERFIRFLVAGGTAAGVNVFSCRLLDLVWSYELSVTVSYLIGMVVAFSATRLFVFDRTEVSLGEQFGRFALVNAISFTMVWCISVGLARLVFPAVGFAIYPDVVAHVIGVVSPTFVSYIGHKRFSFGPRSAAR